jgi:hypothetical protein
MGFYTKEPDKKSGDGLALTEWNDLSSAVAGNSGLTLATNPEDKVGIGTKTPDAKLQVVGGAIMPSAGDSESSGILFPKDPGGGASDRAWLRYYNREGEKMTLELGIANDASDHIALMPSGNVGIGTNDPQDTLEVNGNVRATKFIGDGSQLTNLSVGETGLNLAATSGNVGIGTKTPEAKLHVINKSTDARGKTLVLGPIKGSNLRMGYHEDYSWVQSHGTKPLTINPIGNNVGIGTTSPQDKLEVKGTLRLSSSNNHCQMFVEEKRLVFKIKTSKHGANRGVSWDGDSNWDSSSDERLKTNIAHEKGILPRLMQLDVKNYHWKDSPDKDKQKSIGLIAQDVQPLFPSLVGEMTDPETKETTLTLKYASFGVLAVGAIKELKQAYDQQLQAQEKEINALRAAHEGLQGELSILRKQMERLLAEA